MNSHTESRLGDRRTIILAAAVAVMALHIIDDNFVQPASGTGAVDHAASGLIPLACLAVMAFVFQRVRDGGRACIAIVLGLFGVTLAIEAVYYTQAVGPSGDDYSGLAALPAGLAALGIGLHLAWISRRKGGTRRRRVLRRTGIGGAAVLMGYYLVMPLSVAYAFTHLSYATVPEPHLGVAPEDVSFKTSDGLTLRGWFVPSRNGAVVIASPGRTSPREEARMLVAHGYGVLLFDRRGEGESDGDPHMLGWSGRADIDAAVSYLHQRGVDPDRIGGIGLSVGGEMLLEAAGESDGLRAVVSEGGSTRSMADDFTQPGLAKWVDFPGFVVRDAALTIFSNRRPPAKLAREVEKIAPRPVFFIAGEKGQPFEVDFNRRYFESLDGPKQLWIVPGATHIGGYEAQPNDYESRVVAFFDETLLPNPPSVSSG